MQEELGELKESINLRPAPPITLGSAILLILAGAGSTLCIAPYLSVIILALGIAGLAMTPVILYFVNINEPHKIALYETGFVVTDRAGQHIILWRDVTGAQLSQSTDFVKDSPTAVPYIIPVGFGIVVGNFLIGSSEHRQRMRCVFHLVDHTKYELKGDGRLFELANEIKARVFSWAVPDAIRRFEAGESIPLTDGVTYSQEGLKGTLIRQTSHSRREIPIDLRWGDIKRLFRTAEYFRITPSTGQPFTISMVDIINSPAFIKILKNLYEQNIVPSMNR